MKKSNNIILAGDDSLYRVVWYTYKNEKRVSNWMVSGELAQAWVADSNKSIPSHLETTFNISSLGGITIESKEKEVVLLEKRMGKCFESVRDDELLKNLEIQLLKIQRDIKLLQKYPTLIIFLNLEDVEEFFKIVR